MTGLYNYSAFDKLFHDSDQEHIAVLIAEIDGYAGIRTKFGRDVADRVACRFADALRNSFRSVDHVCRLRENEFAVIVARMIGGQKDLVFSKLQQVCSLMQTEEDGLPSVSIRTCVVFADRKNPIGDVFEDADAALIRMKEGKQTGFTVFD